MALYQFRVDDRELAAILAGLRLLQGAGRWERIELIATDGGRLFRLSATEIDALCERLTQR